MKTFQQFAEEIKKINQQRIKPADIRTAVTGGMSSSLQSTGTPSGRKFMPGQGDSYGIGGTKLAT